MGRVQQSIEVNAPLRACFDQWMNFEEFPRFMDNVKRISRKASNRWHWVVSGPMGVEVDWEAVMDGKFEDRVVSWHTVEDSQVTSQGAARFEEVAPNVTRVTSTFEYQPPAGPIGEVVAKIFSNPDKMVKEDLRNFKELMESKVGARR